MRWGKWSRPHRQLLGQATQSYRWMNVRMVLKLDAMGVSAHHRMYASLNEFVASLQEFESFTCGDPTPPKRGLAKMQPGDLLVFYAGMEG